MPNGDTWDISVRQLLGGELRKAAGRAPGGGGQQDQLRVVEFWHDGLRSRMSGTAPPPPASAPADPIGGALHRPQPRLFMPPAVALLASEVEWFVGGARAILRVGNPYKSGGLHSATSSFSTDRIDCIELDRLLKQNPSSKLTSLTCRLKCTCVIDTGVNSVRSDVKSPARGRVL